MVGFTTEQAEALLERVVAAFNAAARTGDVTAFVDLFTDDAVMDFEGIPEEGPFEGREAIAEKFRDDPPDDEVRVRRWKAQDNVISAEFYLRDIPEAIGGCFTIEPRYQKIARLTIAFGGPGCKFR
jgi:hypothetical protein